MTNPNDPAAPPSAAPPQTAGKDERGLPPEPCPCCASTRLNWITNGGPHRWRKQMVKCSNCGLGIDADDALMRWNRRAPAPPAASATAAQPMRMLISPERLLEKIQADPDDAECEVRSSPPASVSREAIARLIDPSSWRVMDGYLADLKRKYAGENIGYDPDAFKHKASLAVADAILALLPGQAGWRPIESAPKDGARIMVWFRRSDASTDDAGQVMLCRWIEGEPPAGQPISAMRRRLYTVHGGYWSAHYRGEQPLKGRPLAWMPLPPPPSALEPSS